MKKFTFLMIALLCAVVTFAAGPNKQFIQLPFTPAKANVQLGKQFNAKQAPAAVAKKFQKAVKAKARSPKKAVAAADLVSDYQWDYLQANSFSTQPDTLETKAGSARVSIALGEAEPTEFETVFDFNSMDVPTSSSVTQDGDIKNDTTLVSKDVNLTITPKEEGKTTENRFWSTTAGPQLRIYSGTMTFDVPEGLAITEIVFNHNGKWGSNTVGEEVIPNDADAKVATWNGEAQQVVVAIAANSQINSIEVAYSVVGAEEAVGDPIVISGMFTNDLKGTFISSEEGDYIVIPAEQAAGTSSYGDYTIYSMFYYEGDETYEAGWYRDDIYAYIQEDGTIYFPDWICRVLTSGSYVGYNLTPHYVEGSTFTPVEPLVVVTPPEGVEAEEYSMFYEDEDGATGAVTVQVAVDGSDVYVQGFSYYIPDAWVKGTKDGNVVTFPAMQYVGQYYGYDSYAFYEDDAVFTYDAEADTYTAEGEIYGVLGEQYYDGHYFNPVIKKVTEKATMPADPAITALVNGDYGWYFTFNVPVVDVNGDALVTSKLAYKIYTNTDGVIAALTFTPATHTKLTEDMTEIPYGFTESYDFYDTQIYLNDLYSADWNGIGIQSIYRGGGEENVTEIQWFDIAKPVVLPEGVEAEEYTMAYEDSEGNSAAKTVNVAVDGSDVYIQGFSEYIPEAWVKGTKDGNTVTFPAKQLMGKYQGYESYAFYEGDAVFTYDAEADTYTAEGEIYGVLGGQYYDGHYFNPVIKKVTDKAAMPADPEITAMENGTYGWYIDFNVPAVDVNGEDLAIGKLSYMIYTDTQGEVAPLTFTSETHTKLTEDMTEIPYGFTENYDFSTNKIYLNDLYSADWTRIGIQSIYRGGGEENVTEIQWFDILPEPEAIEAPEGLETETYLFTANEVENGVEEARRAVTNTDVTFDFNAMDVATSSSSSTEGDITEDLVLTEGDVKLTVSPKTTGSTENRFWYVNNVGPQLRVYSGTLTFEVPEGSTMTQIVFNHNGKWGANTVGEVAIANDADAKVATWTGDAQQVVVTIAANSQIDNIVVTVKSESGDEPVEEEYNYSYQMQVGFDGQDVYFKGISEDTADMWLKGTLSEDGKTVTIPANQYLGEISFWGHSFPYFFTAVAEDGETMEDIVLNYDAENNKFATDQVLVLHDGKRKLGEPYQTFYDVVITKMEEFAATPADPIFEDYDFEKGAGYNKIYASIPTVDVDGNDLLTSKLFYTIWYEKDGVEQPYIFTAALYSSDFEEDVTEVPYVHDGYDIYKGGEIIYLEDDPAELATWTKVGIQSIYYGGGECNKSNIVWSDPITTGIANVNVDSKNAVIFDLQGRRVAKATKGLYIVDGKKVVMK